VLVDRIVQERRGCGRAFFVNEGLKTEIRIIGIEPAVFSFTPPCAALAKIPP